MPKGRNSLPDNKRRSETTLAKVLSLAPLLSLIIQVLEFVLKMLKMI